ncbi:DUF4412 domain-containing protein [Cyclobacterium marinum]|uniref:DUF4412 domain-containing protein n=1 Tax=Cyclobacterium marinum TaxID=104 RepID=UPI0011F034F3|nr:DUF4412 domain-containing protein [Cyclobacterium marinum]MBI0400104.1 DUF4412 domain-containing protein [Cyclobacterium marinum]
MNFKSLFILLISLSFLSYDAHSQLLRKIKRAASQGVSRAVEKTVEKEVEKATQRQLEKTFRNLYGDLGENTEGDTTGQGGSSNGTTYDFSKVMGSINMNVDTESEYSFTGLAVIEIKSTNKKGKEEDPVNFNSFLTDNSEYYGMEFIDPEGKNDSEKSIIIMDHKNNATVILVENEEEKSSMAFGMDYGGMMDNYPVDNDGNSLGNGTFEKTGNTKEILGYTCEEYRMESEDSEGTYWISKEPVEGLEGFWSKNSPLITKKMKEQNSSYFTSFPDGNIMEMYFTDNDEGVSSQMKIIKIDTNQPRLFELADYPNPMKAN